MLPFSVKTVFPGCHSAAGGGVAAVRVWNEGWTVAKKTASPPKQRKVGGARRLNLQEKGKARKKTHLAGGRVECRTGRREGRWQQALNDRER